MRRTLRRISLLVTLVVELCWMTLGHNTHRKGSEAVKQWETEVRSCSNLDELLRLTDFPDWKLWKCRLRLQAPDDQAEIFPSPLSLGSHRSTRYAAESFSLEILQAIDEEWQRTQCTPRETCVDVAKELGTDPSIFFKPPCVSVHRCGGCCNQEGLACKNTSYVHVNKTIFSVIPFKFNPEPVLIKVANHTECKCMEPAIIRRNAQPHRSSDFAGSCLPISNVSDEEDSKRLCASGLIWDCSTERCIPFPSSTTGLPSSSWLPDCEIDVEQCECLPRAKPIAKPKQIYHCQLNASICAGKHQRFDKSSCRCRLPK